jgi:alkylated DNA repair dioxygenase AlkB
VAPHVPFQPGLFESDAPSFDASFASLMRIELDEDSWVDHVPGWVSGSDLLFVDLLDRCQWGQRERWMYDRKVIEPRLTAIWELASGAPLQPPLLEEARRVLSGRYGIVFDSAGFNLYRDGRDSVAWHGDRIEKEIERPVVALLSLGERRKFLLRPRGGGRSQRFLTGRGDLIVMGGRSQRSWEHSVPKVARAGPRLTVAFRHGLDRRAYAGTLLPDTEH